MSVDGRVDTENVVDVYNGILSSCKKEGNLAICDNGMTLKDIIY